MDLHVQVQLLIEQFHVLGSIHSGVRRNELHSSSVMTRHGTPTHLARRVFHCGYNIFLVKLLHGAFIRKHFLPLSESPMAMTSGKVQSVFLHHWCQVRLSCRPVGLQSKYFTGTSRNSAGTYCCTF